MGALETIVLCVLVSLPVVPLVFAAQPDATPPQLQQRADTAEHEIQPLHDLNAAVRRLPLAAATLAAFHPRGEPHVGACL